MQPYTRSLPRVSDIKAKFEAKQQNTPTRPASPQRPSSAGDVADMTSSPPKRAIRAQQQQQPPPQPSIDSVIDSVPANAVSPAAIRPHTSKHPSWVGPKPQGRKTPSIAPMKQSVTISFASPGLRPPVYLGTDLTDPQWEPVEMDCEQTDRGAYTFCKSFAAEEGEYQYKLRLGPGDWWICDDSKPKVDDGAGNENNSVVVTADASVPPPASKEPEGHPLDNVDLVTQAHADAPVPPTASKESGTHPLDKVDSVTQAHADAPAPLLRHETFAPPGAASHDDGHGEDYHEDTPLLRHESVQPSSHEQDHSPLFRHETMAIDDKRHDVFHHGFNTVRDPSSDSIPQEADPNDPSLEKFPTDHKGILEHLDRTRSSMQADETSHEPGSPAQLQSPASSAITSVSPSLPSVREDEDGELEHLHQGSKSTAQNQDEEIPPTADMPTLRIVEVDVELSERPAAPITPPETPKEDDADRELVDSPTGTRMRVEQLKELLREKTWRAQEKLQETTEQAGRSALSGLFLVLSFAAALASAGVAWWYYKASVDNVVAEAA